MGVWKTNRGGGSHFGYHDPTLGATGTNVFGVNLAGDYSTTVGGPYYLKAGPFNFSSCRGVKLQFQRWLNTDYQPYVAATIDVSNDGTTWASVYKNPSGSPVLDSKWTQVQYDISSVADKHSTVYVRWGYAILSVGAIPSSGWNIDDIQFLGSGPPVTPSIPSSASEASGVIRCGVTLAVSSTTAVTVSLVSSDPKTITVPATVTIPAGQTGIGFPLTINNDSILNGTRNVSITASAQGYASQSKAIAIYDDDTAALNVSLPSSIREGSPTATGTVTMSAPAGADVTVALSSSDPARLAVGNAVIRAGQTSGMFSITAIDNHKIDGTETVSITAHVENWMDGSSKIDVLDNETATLSLSIPATVREGDGTIIGFVQIPGTLTTDLVVSLFSDNTGKIIVPTTATIPAGQTSGTFGMTITDNTIADGAQTVTITATASAFTSASAQIVVADNDLDHFVVSSIGSPQIRNAPFAVSITAYAVDNTVITNYAGAVMLSASGANGPLPISPTSATNFVNGICTENITVGANDGGAILIANDGAGHTGTSNVFAVGTGALHHFGFSPIPSPQVAGTPFAITVTAQDAGNNTVTDFSGQISLSALSGSTSSSNAAKVVSASGSNVNDTAKNRKLELVASGSSPAYRTGTITQIYPLIPQTTGTVSLPITPTSTGNFISGVWSGSISVLQPGVAVALSGSDNLGHSGTSNTFDITAIANMAVSPAAGINSSGIVGGPFTPASATYTVSNNGTGPMDWTVSGTSSWLSFSPSGGTVASGSSVTVTVTINSAASALLVGSYSDTIAFVNTTSGFGNTTRSAALTVLSPPPVITSPLTATGTNGTAFSYQIAATNSPTSYAASGLPLGLSVNPTTGVISGTPTVTGTSNVSISASNDGATGSATLILVVLPHPPVITSSLSATGTCGVTFSYQIAATNSPTSYDATGLPSGLSVNPTTGVISGTPTGTGTSNVTISASNAGGTGSAVFTLTVVPLPPPVLTSSPTVSGTFGAAFNYQITASNFPASYGATNLPLGLSINTVTGLISGIPIRTGTFSATISAANASGSASATLLISVQTMLARGRSIVAWGLNTSGQTNVPGDLNNIAAIASGWLHCLALKSDGTVSAWGNSADGKTTIPAGLKNVVAISGGGYHSLALKADGTVVAWGSNTYGQTNVPSGLDTVVAVAAGYYHSLALKSDGTVVAWGDQTVPSGLNNVVAIAAGVDFSLALKSDGTVFAWGWNGAGQVTVPAGLSNVVAIAAGGYHCLALKSDGTVVAWGSNSSGQTTIPTGLNNVVAIAAGGYHSLALKSDGTAVAWGKNDSGQTTIPASLSNVVAISGGWSHSLALVGGGSSTSLPLIISPSYALGAMQPFQYQIMATNTPANYDAIGLPAGLAVNPATGLISGTPTEYGNFNVSLVATNLSGTDYGMLVLTVFPPPPIISNGLTASGTSGSAFAYQIQGTNNPTGYSGSSLPAGLTVNATTGLISGIPIQSGTFSSTISATNPGGTGSATLVITIFPGPPVITSSTAVSGTIQSIFNYQIVGTNSPTSYGATGLPVGLTLNTTTGVISGTLKQTGLFNAIISATNALGSGSAALTIGVQTIAVWGDNTYGQSSVPFGLDNVVAVAGGGHHTLALIAGGRVVGWGENGDGQVTVPNGLSNVVAIAAGGFHSLALKSDGTVAAWGWNVNGQTNVPIGLSNVIAIAAGFEHNLALRSDGTVVAWGWNLYGQASVPSGLKDVVAIAVGENHSLAIKADGTVVAWGDNSYAETNVPAGLNNVAAIAGTGYQSFALKLDGTVVAWGNNGQTDVPTDLNNVTVLSGGQAHSLALKSDGTVAAWGYNYYGQATVPAGLSNVAAISGGWLHSLALIGNKYSTSPPVIISPTKVNGGLYPFQYRITAINSPTSYSATGLPAGLSLDASTGLISGTPTQTGKFTAILSASNAWGGGSANLGLTILAPPPVMTSPAIASGTSGSAFGYQITATNAPSSFGAINLPPGLSVSTSNGWISGTATQPGCFNVTISASNLEGTGVSPLMITIKDTLVAWKNRKFTPAELLKPEISGDIACPAGDGIPNLIKYALNLDPKTSATNGLPIVASTPISGDNFLTLTYTQVISATDITYIPEVSGDLQTWSSGDSCTKVISVTNNADGVTQSVTVQDLNPLNNSISRRFIRLKVTKP